MKKEVEIMFSMTGSILVPAGSVKNAQKLLDKTPAYILHENLGKRVKLEGIEEIKPE